jgi:hypothetical protein
MSRREKASISISISLVRFTTMFSNIHNSPKANKHAPKAGLPAFMGAVIIAVVASSAPAYAHCERHIYNNTSRAVWHISITDQPSNNVVERYIEPGESSSYWIVTDGTFRGVYLTVHSTGLGTVNQMATLDGSSCYFEHEGRSTYGVRWNEPADGDVTIVDFTPRYQNDPLSTQGH